MATKKKYDNNSEHFADWTTKKLKKEAKSYNYIINIADCCSSSDIREFYGILSELEERGVNPKTSLVF